MEKIAKNVLILTLIPTGIVLIVFFITTIKSGYVIWPGTDIAFEETGQSGDFIGGIVGTIFSAGAFLLLYLTLHEQHDNTKKEQLERRFFELIELHRKNVDEMEFDTSKYISDPGTLSLSSGLHRGKEVFYDIFIQVTSCRNELSPFFAAKYIPKYNPSYEKQLKETSFVKENGIDIYKLALLDIAYCIVFFGVGPEGIKSLKSLFKEKYDTDFINTILDYISLKPALDKEKYTKWKYIEDRKDIRRKIDISKAIKKERNGQNYTGDFLQQGDWQYIHDYSNNFAKYYGGHQFRLGHYFRHIFQTVRYMNEQTDLSYTQKYSYMKILRAQLSNYEQAILFFNSLSQLGRKWELDPQINKMCKGYSKTDFELITKYALIKNIPIGLLLGIEPIHYYRNINYETSNRSITLKTYH